jgi:hypothetical protein
MDNLGAGGHIRKQRGSREMRLSLQQWLSNWDPNILLQY